MAEDVRSALTQNLNELLRIKGIKAIDLAETAGVSKSAVSHWLAGDNSPNIEILAKICLAYDVKLSEMLNEKIEISYGNKELLKKYSSLDDYGKEAVNSILDVEFKRCNSENNVIDMTIELPMSELPASAGTGIWLEEGYNTPVTVRKTKEAQKANIVIRVSGDSMEPLYSDGDCVLVKIQPDIEPGEIGIFIVDNEGFIKKRGKHELISVNPEYDNIAIGEFSDCRCFGKVLGKAETLE